jgi:hypothetical protein
VSWPVHKDDEMDDDDADPTENLEDAGTLASRARTKRTEGGAYEAEEAAQQDDEDAAAASADSDAENDEVAATKRPAQVSNI